MKPAAIDAVLDVMAGASDDDLGRLADRLEALAGGNAVTPRPARPRAALPPEQSARRDPATAPRPDKP